MVWRVSTISDWAEWSQQVGCRNLRESRFRPSVSMLEMRVPDFMSSFCLQLSGTELAEHALAHVFNQPVVYCCWKAGQRLASCMRSHSCTSFQKKTARLWVFGPPCPLKSTLEGNVSGHDSGSQSYVHKKMFGFFWRGGTIPVARLHNLLLRCPHTFGHVYLCWQVGKSRGASTLTDTVGKDLSPHYCKKK